MLRRLTCPQKTAPFSTTQLNTTPFPQANRKLGIWNIRNLQCPLIPCTYALFHGPQLLCNHEPGLNQSCFFLSRMVSSKRHYTYDASTNDICQIICATQKILSAKISWWQHCLKHRPHHHQLKWPRQLHLDLFCQYTPAFQSWCSCYGRTSFKSFVWIIIKTFSEQLFFSPKIMLIDN